MSTRFSSSHTLHRGTYLSPPSDPSGDWDQHPPREPVIPARPLVMEGRGYRTILVDPPWSLDQTSKRGAAHHYDVMPLRRITALPVQSLAADDAHLWLWTTNTTLRIGYDVMEQWGFVPRSLLTWIKPTMGLGQYLRSASEYLLFGTRGRAPVKFRGQPNWLFAPRQEHSHKPEEQYGVIERVSEGPYLELFARRRQPGWHVWGNEIDSDITIPGFPVPSDTHRYEPVERPV